jgi:hypothetical protein
MASGSISAFVSATTTSKSSYSPVASSRWWRRSSTALRIKALGRPKIDQALEGLVVRMAQENRSRGYDRIVGALANLGFTISDQILGNILKRHGMAPAPERETTATWKEFIRTHLDVLVATELAPTCMGIYTTLHGSHTPATVCS